MDGCEGTPGVHSLVMVKHNKTVYTVGCVYEPRVGCESGPTLHLLYRGEGVYEKGACFISYFLLSLPVVLHPIPLLHLLLDREDIPLSAGSLAMSALPDL